VGQGTCCLRFSAQYNTLPLARLVWQQFWPQPVASANLIGFSAASEWRPLCSVAYQNMGFIAFYLMCQTSPDTTWGNDLHETKNSKIKNHCNAVTLKNRPFLDWYTEKVHATVYPVFSTPVKKRVPCPSFPPKRPSAPLLKGAPKFPPKLFYPPLNASKWLHMP
jgi:hypothetical protein